MPRKEFEAFTRLDASDVNTFLMDQSVMTFAGTAARGSAIATPVEGMAAYLDDSNVVSLYDGSNWKTSLSTTGGILQVVSALKTDTASIASASFTDLSGLAVTITPKSANNKMLIFTRLNFGVSADANVKGRVIRGSSDVVDIVAFARFSSNVEVRNYAGHALDSPATTDSITYKVQWARDLEATAFLNRRGFDSNVQTYSSITVMEVVA
jgi:hypothetical protein